MSPSGAIRSWFSSTPRSWRRWACPTSRRVASRCRRSTSSWSVPNGSRFAPMIGTATRSRSRLRGCWRSASSTKWIICRARSSSSTCRSSSSNAFARSWPSSCARQPDRAFLRLVFAGTPEFAERALARLLSAGHEVVLALTQPDRPAGRGLRPGSSPVKRLAAAHGIEVLQPPSLQRAAEVERVRAARPDALVVAAYGLILPPVLLEAGRHGALNIHASLLPRWRGAAPIQRALLAGDPETGISIMQMDAGLDTGPVLSQAKTPIGSEDDAGSLHDRLAELGAELILQSLVEVESSRAVAVPPPKLGITYAPKIDKRETRIDWT